MLSFSLVIVFAVIGLGHGMETVSTRIYFSI